MDTLTPNSKKRFSWRSAVLLSIGVAVITLVGSILLQTHAQVFISSLEQGAATTTVAQAKGVGTSYDVPGAPKRLIIPAIGVNAYIQSVGMWWKDPTEIGIPTNFTDVAWYNGGPKPGEPGSAVIDGHLDGATVAQAVFFDLDKLQPGDMVQIVDSDGKTLNFKVTATKLYDYNASTTEIFAGDSSKVRLNLITCAGDWIKVNGANMYNKRVVVFTELVTNAS